MLCFMRTLYRGFPLGPVSACPRALGNMDPQDRAARPASGLGQKTFGLLGLLLKRGWPATVLSVFHQRAENGRVECVEVVGADEVVDERAGFLRNGDHVVAGQALMTTEE